jgi:hypothetical protein
MTARWGLLGDACAEAMQTSNAKSAVSNTLNLNAGEMNLSNTHPRF